MAQVGWIGLCPLCCLFALVGMYMPAEDLIVLFLYFVVVEVSVVRFFPAP